MNKVTQLDILRTGEIYVPHIPLIVTKSIMVGEITEQIAAIIEGK